jgi:hypothetical protein
MPALSQELSQPLGCIDLTHILKPLTDYLSDHATPLFQPAPKTGWEGRLYVLTDKIIEKLLSDDAWVKSLQAEGSLFSNCKSAACIATKHKSEMVSVSQKKHIVALEKVIEEKLRASLQGQGQNFMGQPATHYFAELRKLNERSKVEIDSPITAPFPDTRLVKDCPANQAMARVPYHTLDMHTEIPQALIRQVKTVVQRKLTDDGYDADEIEERVNNIDGNSGHLKEFLKVLYEEAYGRIRRTYACSVLGNLLDKLPVGSPARQYIQRVSDVNELLQGTLPGSSLAASELIIEFPKPEGKGVMSFNLLTELARADSLRKLPYWVTFNELLSEVSMKGRVVTTMGQHFKLNGKVESERMNSVFEFNVGKLEHLANRLAKAIENGTELPGDAHIVNVLRVAVLYYLVFREVLPAEKLTPEESEVVTNYRKLSAAVKESVARKKGLDFVLTRIVGMLNQPTLLEKNKVITKHFKDLLKSRKLDSPHTDYKKTLYLVIDYAVIDINGIERDEPIVSPPSGYANSYLKFLKITRHPQPLNQVLLQEELRFTESLRYLTLPDKDKSSWPRMMQRDLNRRVLGVLFTPKDNRMLYLAEPFRNFTQLVISYDRKRLNSTTTKPDFQSEFRVSLAQLIYVILVYGVLKAVVRLEQTLFPDTPFAQRTLLLMLSLFSATQQFDPDQENGARGKYVEDDFTHHAHKAIEHLIKQHLPTKSQGFRLLDTASWDNTVMRFPAEAKEQIIGFARTHIQKELNANYRFPNIVTGLAAGLDTVWRLNFEPSLKKVACLSVTSRACDKLSTPGPEDRKVLFGEVHRFSYEARESQAGVGREGEGEGKVTHWYRHLPIQAFCDDMSVSDSFKNPSVLFNLVKQLYLEDYRDILIITKVPFQQRIRMTTEEDSTYTNVEILQALLTEQMPGLRIYPLFTQKSFGIRLQGEKQPMFIPFDASHQKIEMEGEHSSLFRVASVLTFRVVGGRQAQDDKVHSGMMDYLFRLHHAIAPLQSVAMSVWVQAGDQQACLQEVLRFFHAQAYESFIKQKVLEAKLEALENIIGEDSVGQQAEALTFPKPLKLGSVNYQLEEFKVNIVAVLRHLERQAELGR